MPGDNSKLTKAIFTLFNLRRLNLARLELVIRLIGRLDLTPTENKEAQNFSVKTETALINVRMMPLSKGWLLIISIMRCTIWLIKKTLELQDISSNAITFLRLISRYQYSMISD